MTDTIIEKDTILVTIGEDHSFNCSVVTIGRTGENAVSQLEIEIPKELASFDAYLEFKKPKGQTTRTPKIAVQNNRIEYDIPQSLLDENGNIEVQLILQGENGEIWKSATKKYVVLKSIDAGEDIPDSQKEDFFSEAQRTMDNLASVCAPVIKETVVGSAVSMPDVSPLEHEIKVKISAKQEMVGQITNLDNGWWDNYPNYGDYVVDHIDYEQSAGEGRIVFTDGSSLDCGMCTEVSIDDIQQGDTVRMDYDREYDDTEYWYSYLLKVGEAFRDSVTDLSCLSDNGYDNDFREGYGDYTVLSVERDEADTVFLVFTDGSSCSYWDVRDNYHLIEIGSVIRYYLHPEGDYIGLFKKGKSITDVTLTKCGKNLVDISQMLNNCLVDNGNGTFAYTRPSSNIYSAAFPLKLKAGTTITINMVQISTTDYSDRLTCFFTYADGTSKSSYIGRGTGMNFTAEKDIVKVQLFSYNVGTKFVFKNFQIELGTTATEYEPYKEPKTYTPNEDGTVEGVPSLYPVTTLLTDTEGVTITAEYNCDTKKYIDKKLAQLVAATVSEGVV